MTHEKRPVIITGNWKMYKTIPETMNFIQSLLPLVKNTSVRVFLAVPFTAIKSASEAVQGSGITVGAQNMNDASEGAFTGEIAGRMLKDAGAQFVILGHSERRRYFKETDAIIHGKVVRALKDGLIPLLCIGETAEERKAGKTTEVLEGQLAKGLADLTKDQIGKVILAYEPVWAIGNDQAATPEVAEEAHKVCRQFLAKTWDQDVADHVVIQYGGSVKPDNAAALLAQPDIDGLLVGGASLKPEMFSQIINFNQDHGL